MRLVIEYHASDHIEAAGPPSSSAPLYATLGRDVLVERVARNCTSPAGRAAVVRGGQRNSPGHRPGIRIDDGNDTGRADRYRRHVLAFDGGSGRQTSQRIGGGISTVGCIC